MATGIPQSLITGHTRLIEQFVAESGSGGATATMADGIARLLCAHQLKEEQFIFPIVAALAAAARDEPIGDIPKMAELARQLARVLSDLMTEHQQIVSAA